MTAWRGDKSLSFWQKRSLDQKLKDSQKPFSPGRRGQKAAKAETENSSSETERATPPQSFPSWQEQNRLAREKERNEAKVRKNPFANPESVSQEEEPKASSGAKRKKRGGFLPMSFEVAEAIRADHASGVSYAQLLEKYGPTYGLLSKSNMSSIVNRKTWSKEGASPGPASDKPSEQSSFVASRLGERVYAGMKFEAMASVDIPASVLVASRSADARVRSSAIEELLGMGAVMEACLSLSEAKIDCLQLLAARARDQRLLHVFLSPKSEQTLNVAAMTNPHSSPDQTSAVIKSHLAGIFENTANLSVESVTTIAAGFAAKPHAMDLVSSWGNSILQVGLARSAKSEDWAEALLVPLFHLLARGSARNHALLSWSVSYATSISSHLGRDLFDQARFPRLRSEVLALAAAFKNKQQMIEPDDHAPRGASRSPSKKSRAKAEKVVAARPLFDQSEEAYWSARLRSALAADLILRHACHQKFLARGLRLDERLADEGIFSRQSLTPIVRHFAEYGVPSSIPSSWSPDGYCVGALRNPEATEDDWKKLATSDNPLVHKALLGVLDEASAEVIVSFESSLRKIWRKNRQGLDFYALMAISKAKSCPPSIKNAFIEDLVGSRDRAHSIHVGFSLLREAVGVPGISETHFVRICSLITEKDDPGLTRLRELIGDASLPLSPRERVVEIVRETHGMDLSKSLFPERHAWGDGAFAIPG